MYLNFSKIKFDKDGRPETPELMLKTMSDLPIGIIPGGSGLKFQINFSEPSEIEFDVPAIIDGHKNDIYDEICGYKTIETESFGVYVTMNPTIVGDGISEVKHVKGYSIEKVLDNRKIFLEEGAYKFCDLSNPYNSDTIMGRILELAPGWSPGSIDADIARKYMVFDQYDDYLLSFVYGDAMEKYRCVFVFDPYGGDIPEWNSSTSYSDKSYVKYQGSSWCNISGEASKGVVPGSNADVWIMRNKRSIHVYNADAEVSSLPIYLDFDNLLKEVEVSENTEELNTALSPFGADELDIRNVNPLGTNWIYDFSYFIANGDIPRSLAGRIEQWQARIITNQPKYRALVGMKASANAELISAQVKLQELKNARETLVVQQSTIVQLIAVETDAQDKQKREKELYNKTQQIKAQDQSIKTQKSVISGLNQKLNSYTSRIQEIVDMLSIEKFFTKSEYEALSKYIIETDITEESFVGTDAGDPTAGYSFSLSGSVSVSGATIDYISMQDTDRVQFYAVSGGAFTISGLKEKSSDKIVVIKGDIIRGTCEVLSDKKCTLSISCGDITVGSTKANGGMITLNGSYGGFTNSGTQLSISGLKAEVFLTTSVGAFQRYAAEMELYDYAEKVLHDMAVPTYEFTVSSGNFIFANEFAPFRDALEMGKGVYLSIQDDKVITPYIIGITLKCDEPDSFDITFSNRFKLHDEVNTLRDQIEKSYSSSRSFDAGKHLSNLVAAETSEISEFIKNSLDAAKNTILAASNQSVVIDGGGIHIGSTDEKYQMRIVDKMIAITDDGWEHAKLAIGLFETPKNGTYFGVNAEVIAGKLLVGNELVIDTGKGHFKVDEDGVYINSMKFYIRNGDNNTSLDDEFKNAADNADAIASKKLAEAVIMLNDGSDPDTAVYYSDIIPTKMKDVKVEEGDLWYVEKTITSDGIQYERGSVYRYVNNGWTRMTSAGIVQAIENAKGAQDTADSKVMFYRQDYTKSGFPKIGAHSLGDLWFNTATEDKDGYLHGKLYRCNGASWDLIEDSAIKENKESISTTNTTISKFYKNGYLTAENLKGVIAAQQAQMKSQAGNVLFDSDGFWLLNTETKATATKAIWMNAQGILFGSGKQTADPGNPNSGWNWTTAISHDGITAQALAGKTISGLKMFGGKLFVGPKTENPGESVNNWNFVVDENGNLRARNGTFSGTVDGVVKNAMVQSSTVQGATFKTSDNKLMMTDGYKFDADYLNLKGITIKNGATTTFAVDSNTGAVTINGKVTLTSGSVINWSNVSTQNDEDNPTWKLANSANDLASDASNEAKSAKDTAKSASAAAETAADVAKKIANGEFDGGTFINKNEIYSPTIYSNELKIIPKPKVGDNPNILSGSMNLYGYYRNTLMHMMKISYYQGEGPWVYFDSPVSAYAYWWFKKTDFQGRVDFHGKVTFYGEVDGIESTAKFG